MPSARRWTGDARAQPLDERSTSLAVRVLGRTELYAQLAAGPVDRAGLQMGQNVAGRMIVAG